MVPKHTAAKRAKNKRDAAKRKRMAKKRSKRSK